MSRPLSLGTHLGQAADGDGAAFAVVARNLDAGDALQRFGDVVVGQLADVFGDDGIDDLLGVLLDQLRLGDAAAGSGDLHRVQLLGGRFRRRGGRGGRILRIGLRAQQRGHTDGHHRAAEITDRTLTHSPDCRNVAMLH